ncbi:hypothetical protein OAE25_02125 [Verrucomicrobiales bacterium]|nr:hypothetical protein [Verrucomicrobiales bacterium]MDC0276580.1 hypothetical protein [Verrucomicrobiales bacterium]MDC0314365.1 hypothetical protein [bacterium]
MGSAGININQRGDGMSNGCRAVIHVALQIVCAKHDDHKIERLLGFQNHRQVIEPAFRDAGLKWIIPSRHPSILSFFNNDKASPSDVFRMPGHRTSGA